MSVIKYTLTVSDGSTHEFLTMDDAINFAVAQDLPETAPVGHTPSVTEVEAAADKAIEDTFNPPVADVPADVPADTSTE